MSLILFSSKQLMSKNGLQHFDGNGKNLTQTRGIFLKPEKPEPEKFENSKNLNLIKTNTSKNSKPEV